HLHRFALGEAPALRVPLAHVIAGHVERAPRESQPAHAVREARGAEPDLRDLQPVAHTHQAVLVGYLEAVELELAMPAVLLGPQDRDAAYDAPARLRGVEEERGEPLARIVRRLRDEDEVPGDAGAGNEPLAALDAPRVAAACRRGEHHRGIRARAGLRLRHRE